MAKKTEETTPPTMEGLDPATLLALLQTFGEVAPEVVKLVQTLADAWKRRRSAGMQSTPKSVASPATEHCCSCCDEALKSAMETVAHLLDCKNCCTPE
jgi:hypothetical protein